MNRVQPDFLACGRCARRARRLRSAALFLAYLVAYALMGLLVLWALGYIASTAPTLRHPYNGLFSAGAVLTDESGHLALATVTGARSQEEAVGALVMANARAFGVSISVCTNPYNELES